jgi:hypothetical protein
VALLGLVLLQDHQWHCLALSWKEIWQLVAVQVLGFDRHLLQQDLGVPVAEGVLVCKKIAPGGFFIQ